MFLTYETTRYKVLFGLTTSNAGGLTETVYVFSVKCVFYDEPQRTAEIYFASVKTVFSQLRSRRAQKYCRTSQRVLVFVSLKNVKFAGSFVRVSSTRHHFSPFNDS